MYSDPTEYPGKIEPTQRAYYNPYEDTSPYHGNVPDIPPPPPKQRRVGFLLLFLSVFCIVLIVVTGALLTVGYVPGQKTHTSIASVETTPTKAPTGLPTVAPTPTPTLGYTPTPTPNYDYTATDILVHMQAVDNTITAETTGETVCIWSHHNYCLSVHATSSVQFSGCPIGNCADTWHFGLWVYATPQEAKIAYLEVANDSQSCTDTSPASSGMYVTCGAPEQEYAHGRCLLLNALDTSVYGQVVTQYCL